jgi:hypothetical protein
MSPGDVFAFAFLMAGIIAVFALITSTVKHWLKFQQRKIEMLAGQTAEKAAQYAAHNAELEDRLRVVERIVSDKAYDIALQIDALRDVRAVESRTVVRDTVK